MITKKTHKSYQSLSKEEKEKSDNMAVNDTKISQKMKNKSWLIIEKKYYKMRKKRLIIIIRNYYFKKVAIYKEYQYIF